MTLSMTEDRNVFNFDCFDPLLIVFLQSFFCLMKWILLKDWDAIPEIIKKGKQLPLFSFL